MVRPNSKMVRVSMDGLLAARRAIEVHQSVTTPPGVEWFTYSERDVVEWALASFATRMIEDAEARGADAKLLECAQAARNRFIGFNPERRGDWRR